MQYTSVCSSLSSAGEFYQMKTFARQIFFLSFWPPSKYSLNSYQVISNHAESQIYSERSSNPYCCRTHAYYR
jgi:hypothetical protein